MKRFKNRIPIAIITTVMFFAPVLASGRGPVPGRAILKLDKGAQADSLVAGSSATVIDSVPGQNTYLLSFPDSVSLETIIGQLEDSSKVLSVQAENAFELPETFQISQGFPDQDAPVYVKDESPIEYYDQASTYDIGLDLATTISTGENALVAVIDNGIDASHPLFADRLSPFGYDFVEGDGDPSEAVGIHYGHGTFVSGLVILTAPDCLILPVRAFNEDGIGQEFDVIQAIYWAIDHDADVINMSFGTPTSCPALADAISAAAAAGVVMVAPSGNEISGEPMYPAAYPGVVAVSSIDTLEVIASFSNYGSYIDLCAPGVLLYSALPGDYLWGYWSGTSFSAPLVSGTAALILALPKSLHPDDVETHLRASARTELAWGTVLPPDIYYGYGAVDAYTAVNSLVRGDMDGSGSIEMADVGILIDHVAHGPDSAGTESYRSSIVGDVNCDGLINSGDVNAMIHWLYMNQGVAQGRPDRPFGPCYTR